MDPVNLYKAFINKIISPREYALIIIEMDRENTPVFTEESLNEFIHFLQTEILQNAPSAAQVRRVSQ